MKRSAKTRSITTRGLPCCSTVPRYRGKNKPESQKRGQPRPCKAPFAGERANAQLKTWRILRKLRCCPWRAGQLAKAIHVLQTRET